MKVLIFGGDGMLGHQLVSTLRANHDVHATFRGPKSNYRGIAQLLPDSAYFGVDATDMAKIADVIGMARPDAMVNAIGIVKQRGEAEDWEMSCEVNSLFPRKLAVLAQGAKARLVTVSTDCVFSGRKGHYTEDDLPDAKDVYGKTKMLGEIRGPSGLTLRTSIIGLELTRKSSLIEWFLSQRQQIEGYTKAIYSGLTTFELARLVNRILADHPQLRGLYHVASEPISKYELLYKLRERLQLDLQIVRSERSPGDKSLDSTRFNEDTGYVTPTWDVMLDELAEKIRERANGYA